VEHPELSNVFHFTLSSTYTCEVANMVDLCTLSRQTLTLLVLSGSDSNRFAMLRLHLSISKLNNSDVTTLIPTTSFLQNIHSNCLP